MGTGAPLPGIRSKVLSRDASGFLQVAGLLPDRFFLLHGPTHPSYTFRMDNERIREICLALPYVSETLNWGHHMVFWVGDRDIGGKMFAMTDLDGLSPGVLWFHCGPERFHELQEREGVTASPHLAKAFWVAVERWDTLPARQIEDELRRAHGLIFEKLPKRTRALLALPRKELAKVIRERKKLLADREKAKSIWPPRMGKD